MKFFVKSRILRTWQLREKIYQLLDICTLNTHNLCITEKYLITQGDRYTRTGQKVLSRDKLFQYST